MSYDIIYCTYRVRILITFSSNMIWKRRKRFQQDRFIKKKLSQKIRERPRRDLVQRASSKLKKKILLITSITAIILILTSILIWRNIFFYGSSQRITSVRITDESLAWYADPQIISSTQEALVNWSRRAIKRFWLWDTLTLQQATYPIIQNIVLKEFTENEALIDIKWHIPQIVFRLPWDKRYWSFEEYLFPVRPNSTIIADSRIIDLPRYTETFDTIDWIYWKISEQELIEALKMIDSTLEVEKISERIYLPGWKKIFLWYDSKRRYFHLNKDLETQIQKLFSVQEFYQEYENISVIDLWSTDNVIVK